ncbi:MAG: redoxin family protein [Bacteroidota bacterium]
MKKINISTIIAFLLLAFVGYRIIKRYLLIPKMSFQTEQLTILDNKQTTSIDALKGNVVIVSCYQTWCGDCARETPWLNELAATINSSKFTVLYISDEPEEKVTRFRKRFDSDKILFTNSEKRLGELGIRSFPSTFLLNKKGEVVKTKLESYDWSKEEKEIRELLNK